MTRKILEVDYHRNGVGGAGYFVALFTDQEEPGRLFLGISFDSLDSECRHPEFVAVLDVEEAVQGNIYMHPPERSAFPDVPVDFDDLEAVDTDQVEPGQFIVEDDAWGGTVLYVMDVFSTEDGFSIPLVCDIGGEQMLYSSNATFWKL